MSLVLLTQACDSRHKSAGTSPQPKERSAATADAGAADAKVAVAAPEDDRTALAQQDAAAPPPAAAADAGAGDDGQFHKTRTFVETVPVPLERMVTAADRIFLGSVEDVKVAKEPLKNSDVTAEVQRVVFRVERVLKAPANDAALKPGQQYTVRQLASVARPVKVGQRLLWYLAPDSQLGLTQPVGIESGHFRIFESGGKSLAVNLKSNQELLNTKTVKTEITNLAQNVNPDKRQVFELQARQYLANVERTGEGRPAPLDLILAKTEQLTKAPR
jgi:hypothetical protein